MNLDNAHLNFMREVSTPTEDDFLNQTTADSSQLSQDDIDLFKEYLLDNDPISAQKPTEISKSNSTLGKSPLELPPMDFRFQ